MTLPESLDDERCPCGIAHTRAEHGYNADIDDAPDPDDEQQRVETIVQFIGTTSLKHTSKITAALAYLATCEQQHVVEGDGDYITQATIRAHADGRVTIEHMSEFDLRPNPWHECAARAEASYFRFTYEVGGVASDFAERTDPPTSARVECVGFIRDGIVRHVAVGRDESDSCERGTSSCCIDHTSDDGSCETW